MSRCRVGIHSWGRWRGCSILLKDRGVPRGTVSGQLRTCRRCGREQVRSI